MILLIHKPQVKSLIQGDFVNNFFDLDKPPNVQEQCELSLLIELET